MRSGTRRDRAAQLAISARPARGRLRVDPESLSGMTARYRMPAEWEPHRATWISWPHHEPDWPGKLGPIPWVYAEIARVLAEHEVVEILCHSNEVRSAAREALTAHQVNPDRFRLHVEIGRAHV